MEGANFILLKMLQLAQLRRHQWNDELILGSEFEESMPSTRTQTTSCNLLLQTYICTAELATWGVGPDVCNDELLLTTTSVHAD